MIESIKIAGCATYEAAGEALNNLGQLNFIFGSNGTGKTTVSRVIADECAHQTCQVIWKAGAKLKPMVYNCDFVKRNFGDSEELKGVFTLGEAQLDTLTKIETAKAELNALQNTIDKLTQALQGDDGTGGKKAELTARETAFTHACWNGKLALDETRAQEAFSGYMGSKEKFKTKALSEDLTNTADVLTQEALEKSAESIFGLTPTQESRIAAADASKLLTHETNSILTKRVIGRADIDIAAMIRKLANSDWVRQGRSFFEANGGVCPFCQQATTEAFANSLDEYFGETFMEDSNAIDALATDYAADAARLLQQVAEIIVSPARFLDSEKLKIEKDLLDAKITLNNQRLAGKKKEPSQVVELESLTSVSTAITSLIDVANAQVAEHNAKVANLANERKTLTAQVWRYTLDQLKPVLAAYKTDKDGLEKGIAAITSRIATANAEKKAKNVEIQALEKQTTTVQPTIDGINKLLSSFGFRGFKLAKTGSGTSYKLVRMDGSDAKASLSEGEKTFVTFLYFYHLLKGSESDSGVTTDRIVVLDDPVSSLDSDVLFIVSSLIKTLFAEVTAETGIVKQIFVLTHNVYFHKEVSYHSPKKGEPVLTRTFWIVRKPGHYSKIQHFPSNPIKTSYQLLWLEVRNPERSNLSIQNTLRRILENYFKILGGTNLDGLCALFDGREKIICGSLCSWMHDGSHNAHDDVFVSIDDSMVDVYLNVFRQIFIKSNHHEHYKMMMGEDFVEIAPQPSLDIALSAELTEGVQTQPARAAVPD